MMEGLEKLFKDLESRIKRLEQAVEHRDAMLMEHEIKLWMLAKDGVIWDRIEHGPERKTD